MSLKDYILNKNPDLEKDNNGNLILSQFFLKELDIDYWSSGYMAVSGVGTIGGWQMQPTSNTILTVTNNTTQSIYYIDNTTTDNDTEH